MPVKFKISVVLVGKSLKVTIPKELCEHIDVKKGDIVEMWADNQHVIMTKQSSKGGEKCASNREEHYEA